MFKFFSIIFFIINYSLAFANTISNCSNCGGIGSKLGEVKPKDPFFKEINLSLTCPQQNGSSYKKAGKKVWTTDLRGFYNDDYLWVHKLKVKSLKQQARVLIGFKNKNNKLEFDGIDFNFSQKDGPSQKRFLGFQEFTKNIPSSISNGIDIERASLSGGKSRICLLKITDLFPSKLDLMGKGQIENSIKNVKNFDLRIIEAKKFYLNQEQKNALKFLNSKNNIFDVSVLQGTTGSGKTLVYFERIKKIIAENKQALVLLPEIFLTNEFKTRFYDFFGFEPAIWHSKITPKNKRIIWNGIVKNNIKLVVGARSSLLLPFKKLGVIIVDEEHDTSYKQDEGVIYHARDMAIARASFEKIPIHLIKFTSSIGKILKFFKKLNLLFLINK